MPVVRALAPLPWTLENILQTEPVSVPIPGRLIFGSTDCHLIQPTESQFRGAGGKDQKKCLGRTYRCMRRHRPKLRVPAFLASPRKESCYGAPSSSARRRRDRPWPTTAPERQRCSSFPRRNYIGGATRQLQLHRRGNDVVISRDATTSKGLRCCCPPRSGPTVGCPAPLSRTHHSAPACPHRWSSDPCARSSPLSSSHSRHRLGNSCTQ